MTSAQLSRARLELGVVASFLIPARSFRLRIIELQIMLAPLAPLLVLACTAPTLISSAAVGAPLEKRLTLLDGFYNASAGGGSWLTVSTFQLPLSCCHDHPARSCIAFRYRRVQRRNAYSPPLSPPDIVLKGLS